MKKWKLRSLHAPRWMRLRLHYLFAFLFLLLSLSSAGAGQAPAWLVKARISSPYDDPSGLSSWEDGVRSAVRNGATVILDWGLASDNWKVLFEPDQTPAVNQLQNRAAWIHQNFPTLHYIVYMAPLEYVSSDLDTDGDGIIDPGREADSLSLQHSEWAQLGIDGRPAFFFGFQPGMPFWVCPSCEDVWVSPANPEFRQVVLSFYHRLSQAGLDGLWIDVPFLMDEFGENWDQQFPDISPAARDLFENQTGWSLGAPPILPNWQDRNWQEYIRWRYRLIEDFLGEIKQAVQEERPDFAVIVESSVSWNNRMTGFGASPVDIPGFVSTTAHELGGTERPVSIYAWQDFLAQLQAWRHMDLDHSETSWLLSYVEAGHADTFELGRLHAAVASLSGFSLHVSGSEDMTTMHDRTLLRKVNAWLGNISSDLWLGSTRPLRKTAVLFSRATMDYISRASWGIDDYSSGLAATLMILQEHHIPYELLSIRELERLGEFQAVVLPDAPCLSDGEAEQLRQWVSSGGRLLSTGRTSSFDELGNSRSEYALADVFGVQLADVEDEDGRVFEQDFGQGHSVFAPAQHEQYFFWEADPENPTPSDAAAAEHESAEFFALYQRLGLNPILSGDAPSSVVLLPWESLNGKVLLSVINLTGLSSQTATSEPLDFDLRFEMPRDMGRPSLRWTEILESSQSLSGTLDEFGGLAVHIQVRTGGLLEILPGRTDDGDVGLVQREPLCSE